MWLAPWIVEQAFAAVSDKGEQCCLAWSCVLVMLPIYLSIKSASSPPDPPLPLPAQVEPDAVRATVTTPHGPIAVAVTPHALTVNGRALPWSAVEGVGIDVTNALVVHAKGEPVLPVVQVWEPSALLAVHQACLAAIERDRTLLPPDPQARAALDRLRSGPTRRD